MNTGYLLEQEYNHPFSGWGGERETPVLSQVVAKVGDHRVILGSTIRTQRMRAGLTLEGLAESADLHPNYLGRVERGEEFISVSALFRIAEALKIRNAELLADL